MPSLEILKKYTAKPSVRKWEETRVFVSGNGRKAIFRSPFEFHMGAYAWELEVHEDGLKSVFSTSGLLCPRPYQPWSSDSRCLFLSSIKEGSFIRGVASGIAHKVELDKWVVYALGSRRYPKFLTVTDKGEYLVAIDGK